MQNSGDKIKPLNKTLNDDMKAIDRPLETTPQFIYCKNDRGRIRDHNPAVASMAVNEISASI